MVGRSLLIACAVVTAATTARADTWIETYTYDFGAAELDHFSGTDGWESGYDLDEWTTLGAEPEVHPRTDDEGGLWADRDATANHLTQIAQGPFGEASVEVKVTIADDDAIGLILRKSGHDTFYLFFMTRDAAPALGGGGDSMSGEGAYIYRVRNGNAALRCANEEPEARFTMGAAIHQRLRFEMVGDTLRAYYDTDTEGPWDPDEALLECLDADPLGPGHVALYAYNAGEGAGQVGFADLRVHQRDTDDDGAADDVDCAPDDDTVHPGAGEACDDGVDNDCDGLVDDLDDDCFAGDDDDDDDDSSGDDDDDPSGITLIETAPQCSTAAASAPTPVAGLLAAIGLAALRARRNRK